MQDAGFPDFVNWLAETVDVPGTVQRFFHFFAGWVRLHLSKNPPSDLAPQLSALLGDGSLTRGMLPLLGMGREVPDGQMYLNDDGYLALDWTADRSEAYYGRVREAMRGIAANLGATYPHDPVWYLKRVITVHPLGGCPMGRTASEGVVDSHGQVFGYPGFFIADGSVLPGPVGPNPSFTIAACADRFADRLLGI